MQWKRHPFLYRKEVKKMKNWVLLRKGGNFTELGRRFGIHPRTAALIRNRDIIGEDAMDRYLNGTIADLYDGMLMKDMDKAVEILKEKITEELKRQFRPECERRNGKNDEADDKCVQKAGDELRDHAQRERHAVRLVHLFDFSAVHFSERRRQTDERAHRDDEHRHGRDERFPCGGIDRDEDPAHEKEEQERHQIAGDEHRFAADIQPELQPQTV